MGEAGLCPLVLGQERAECVMRLWVSLCLPTSLGLSVSPYVSGSLCLSLSLSFSQLQGPASDARGGTSFSAEWRVPVPPSTL